MKSSRCESVVGLGRQCGDGVLSAGVMGRASGLDGFFGCDLELGSDQIISISADQCDLGYKCEVLHPIEIGCRPNTRATGEAMPWHRCDAQ